MSFWSRKKRLLLQLFFVLSIVYSISTINVLVVFVSILPFLQDVSFKTSVLVHFARISFGLAAFLSIYHFFIVLHPKKRKNDELDEKNMVFSEIWKRVNPVSKALVMLILLYIIPSVYVLSWGLGFASNMPGMSDDIVLISFTITSYVLVVLIAAFHHSTAVILRRKRKNDKLAETGNLHPHLT